MSPNTSPPTTTASTSSRVHKTNKYSLSLSLSHENLLPTLLSQKFFTLVWSFTSSVFESDGHFLNKNKSKLVTTHYPKLLSQKFFTFVWTFTSCLFESGGTLSQQFAAFFFLVTTHLAGGLQ
jgi:hypothetical protein